MLKLTNIEVMYNGIILVLKGVTLEVPTGGIVVLLGANGAGKTTTLKSISGLIRTEEGAVSGGAIEFEGRRITNSDPTSIVRLGLVQVMEGRRVLQHMRVEQNLLVGAHLRSDKEVKGDLDRVYSYFPRLGQLRNNTAGFLSGGEQQMLVIGRALMARPKLVLLDEVSLGLAPLLVNEIYEVLQSLNRQEKLTMLVVEQNAIVALEVANYGYVMENGHIVLEGSGEDLRKNEDIKEFYLGLSLSGGRRSYREVKHYKRRKRWLG